MVKIYFSQIENLFKIIILRSHRLEFNLSILISKNILYVKFNLNLIKVIFSSRNFVKNPDRGQYKIYLLNSICSPRLTMRISLLTIS